MLEKLVCPTASIPNEKKQPSLKRRDQFAGSISVGQHPISTKMATLPLICYVPEMTQKTLSLYLCPNKIV
jgi:hypothetical protein